MSIQTELTRITNDRNTIRTKLVELGLATSSDNLDTLAEAIDDIADKGTPDAEVKEGESYTIAAGYYHGGTVRGVAGGGHYELQTKTGIVPTKSEQTITPDSGYYGLASVTVDAIPDNYADVSSVTAAAGDVLTGKSIVDADGVLVAGTMVNRGAVTQKLDTTTKSYTVPAGYHNGSGAVTIETETKNATPSKSSQNITPSAGKVLDKVVVAAIPSNYVDIDDYSETNAAAANILTGKTAYLKDEDGFEEVTGSMPNNGSQSATLTTASATKTIPAGYTSGGTVDVSSETKSVTPSTSQQTITGSSNKFLSSVTVAAIPAIYGDATNADAIAGNILTGKKAVVKSNNAATLVTGTMANNGSTSATIDGLTTMSATIPAGYTSGGTVTLTNDIENALALI